MLSIILQKCLVWTWQSDGFPLSCCFCGCWPTSLVTVTIVLSYSVKLLNPPVSQWVLTLRKKLNLAVFWHGFVVQVLKTLNRFSLHWSSDLIIMRRVKLWRNMLYDYICVYSLFLWSSWIDGPGLFIFLSLPSESTVSLSAPDAVTLEEHSKANITITSRWDFQKHSGQYSWGSGSFPPLWQLT